MSHDRLEKLRELAERGVGGERENAQRMLDVLCKKLGFDVEQLNGDSKEIRYYTFNDNYERILVTYVVGQVTDVWPNDIDRWKPIGKGNRTKIGFKLTAAQAAEVHLNYDVYLSALKEAHYDFFMAFIAKNGIFPQTAQLSDDLRDTPPKINPFMDALTKTHIRKRLV